jgi:hypothetical protein
MPRRYLLAIAVILLSFVGIASAGAPAPPMALLSGFVQDATTHQPVGGARVMAGSLAIVTGADGRIPITRVPLTGVAADVDIVVSAAGYTAWRFPALTLRAGAPVELRVRLHRVPANTQQPGSGAAPNQPPAPRVQPADLLTPPDYIDVGRTYQGSCVVPSPDDPIVVQRMRFEDYARNVLPNEWIASWGQTAPAALDAGAVAVKQYAWYTAFVERKWRRNGYTFDVLDSTCDQHYVDDSAHPLTDAALQRTWSEALTRDGMLIPISYRAYDWQCPAIPGCMGQNDSYDRALAGESAVQILQYYYGPISITRPTLTPQSYLPVIVSP